ncbi:olfactory receptor class A-like protein 1 [Discoglossus pictus]
MEIPLQLKTVGFILLVVVGIPANIFVFLKFAYIRILEKKLLPANTILMALSSVNILVLLSRVLIQALNYIGLEDLLNDRQCKLVIYTYRVSRAMSICVTSLLSCHQCILIAPVTGKWPYLKQMVNTNISIIITLILCMNMSLYPSSILYGRARSNATASPYTLRLVYCDVDFLNYVAFLINGMVSVIREIIFVALMTLSSSYMVSVLHRHRKSMKGKRSSDKGQSKTIEYKAARSIILLVAMYVAMFGMDNLMWIYTLTLPNVSSVVNDTRLFLAASFAVLSPFLIFVTNPKLQQGFINPWKKKPMTVQICIT